jgi:hypothetical protein
MKISNILSNTESETNRNAFQQTYLVKPLQILQPVALLMFRVEAIPMLLLTVPIYMSFVKIVYTWNSPFVMDDHTVKHRTNLTWHICIGTVRRSIGIASTRNIRSATGCRIWLLSHVYKLCGSYLNTPVVVTR